MPKYKVVDGHKKIDGKLWGIGDVVECSEDVAAQLRLEPIIGTEESQKSADGSQDTKDKKGKKKEK